MTFETLRSIVASLGGEARIHTFDDGYTVYVKVPVPAQDTNDERGATVTEFMRYSYQNGDVTRPEDRIHAGLILLGLLEDDPSVDSNY